MTVEELGTYLRLNRLKLKVHLERDRFFHVELSRGSAAAYGSEITLEGAMTQATNNWHRLHDPGSREAEHARDVKLAEVLHGKSDK